jgi:Tfp pilus assembly protein PilO
MAMMILTHREKRIAIISGAVLVLLLLYYFVLGPYLDQSKDIDDRTLALKGQEDKANELVANEVRLKKTWDGLQKVGLTVDSSTAESQAEQAVIDWADNCGMALVGLRPGKTAQEGKFQIISFNVTGTGSMPDIARMTWALESATIPVRVTDMQLKPRKEGTDDLLATFTVSALCLPPDSRNTADRSLSSASAANGDATP